MYALQLQIADKKSFQYLDFVTHRIYAYIKILQTKIIDQFLKMSLLNINVKSAEECVDLSISWIPAVIKRLWKLELSWCLLWSLLDQL